MCNGDLATERLVSGPFWRIIVRCRILLPRLLVDMSIKHFLLKYSTVYDCVDD